MAETVETAIDTTGERRQIAKTLTFPPEYVQYINWDHFGTTRAALNCDLHAATHADGSVTISLYWKENDTCPH